MKRQKSNLGYYSEVLLMTECLCPPTSYVEALTPSVIESGERTYDKG